MNVCIYTLGCKQNYAESAYLRNQFVAAGHTVVDFDSTFDVFLINTCSVTENADAECRKLVRRVLRQQPSTFVAITGCYAQLQPEAIASIDGVDAVFGARHKFTIPKLVGDFRKRDTPMVFADDDELDDLDFVAAVVTDNATRTRAFLKIQDGCDYSCSFCTIPMARGGGRSMILSDVVASASSLVASGFREIVLTGINLGEYQDCNGARFVDVVRALQTLCSDVRFRISSLEPNKVTNDIIECVAESSTFCHHFHIPLQSGSDTILRAMRRRYTSSMYASLIQSIHERIPNVGIGIDVICGFPGETDELFDETYAFLEALSWSYLHVFRYSERPNTPAASKAGAVSSFVRKQRTRALRQLSLRKHREFLYRQIGTNVLVIPEKPDAHTGERFGYTSNYARVRIDDMPHAAVQAVSMRIDDVAGDVLVGRVLDVHRPSESSLYLPLTVLETMS